MVYDAGFIYYIHTWMAVKGFIHFFLIIKTCLYRIFVEVIFFYKM